MIKGSKIFQQIAMVTQFGLSLVVPLLMCIGGAWLLNNKAGVGLWIYIPGFIFGLGSSFVTAYKFYQIESKKAHKEEKTTVSFNCHE